LYVRVQVEGSFYDYSSFADFELSVTVEVGGLTPEKMYAFSYVPINDVSACPDTTLRTVKSYMFSTTTATLPTAILLMEQAGATGGGINIVWETPLDTGSGGPIYYQLYMSSARLGSPQWTIVYNGTANSYWKTKLTKTTEYLFIATCMNEVGYSEFSSPYTFTTSYISVPGPVSALTKGNVTGGMVCLSWVEPDDNGGDPVKYYRVYATDEATQTGLSTQVSTPAACLGSLVANTAYSITTYAVNDLGEATDADSLIVKTLNMSTPSSPGEPRVINSSGGAATLAIPAPSDTGGVGLMSLNYAVYANGIAIRAESVKRLGIGVLQAQRRRLQASRGALDDLRPPLTRRLEAEDTTYVYVMVGGLLPSTSYSFSVQISNDAGQSEPTTSAVGTTSVISTPAAPDPPRREKVTGGALYLAWDDPVDTGGIPLTSFILIAKAGDTEAGRCEGLILHCMIGNLFPLTDYSVSVVAINALGASSPSVAAVFTTDMPSRPQSPQNPSITSISNTAITVAWEACLDFGGSTVESYYVQVVEVLNSSSIKDTSVPAGTLNATLTGVTAAMQYVVTVVRCCICHIPHCHESTLRKTIKCRQLSQWKGNRAI
jgi:hypothetical protein